MQYKIVKVKPEGKCQHCGSEATTMTDWAEAKCKDCGKRVRVVVAE